MQDLSQSTYTTKYNAALDAAKKYYSETVKNGKLTDKPNKQLEDLFNYYCPDPPVTKADI